MARFFLNLKLQMTNSRSVHRMCKPEIRFSFWQLVVSGLRSGCACVYARAAECGQQLCRKSHQTLPSTRRRATLFAKRRHDAMMTMIKARRHHHHHHHQHQLPAYGHSATADYDYQSRGSGRAPCTGSRACYVRRLISRLARVL